MDPFATALDAIFNAPGSLGASYEAVSGTIAAIRVIRSQPDETVNFGTGRVIEGTNIFEIRRSEVEQPMKGDLIVIDETAFKTLGDHTLDTEGLTWTVGATPVV